MAIGWLSVLKIVPWSDVIGNAPVVVDGARKLWNAVSGKAAAEERCERSRDAAEGAILTGRVDILEAKVADLHGQMLASSELIQALADQNSQLIARIEVYRRGAFWLAAAGGGGGGGPPPPPRGGGGWAGGGALRGGPATAALLFAWAGAGG
jgi:hypothetical protein